MSREPRKFRGSGLNDIASVRMNTRQNVDRSKHGPFSRGSCWDLDACATVLIGFVKSAAECQKHQTFNSASFCTFISLRLLKCRVTCSANALTSVNLTYFVSFAACVQPCVCLFTGAEIAKKLRQNLTNPASHAQISESC